MKLMEREIRELETVKFAIQIFKLFTLRSSSRDPLLEILFFGVPLQIAQTEEKKKHLNNSSW